MTDHLIVNGDSRSMASMGDKSVQLVVTSPPYWQLKDYGPGDQIGFHQDYEDYINNLSLVWNECLRVLESGCRLCVNIGDQFARSAYYGRYKVIPIRTEIIKFCETVGFDYMGSIIWQKVTTCNTSGGGSVMGSFPTPRNGIIKIDYEFILIFKKFGKERTIDRETRDRARLTTEEWNQYFYGHWNFPGAKGENHLAPFPEELPRRLIRMFTFLGETVLDPFAGSGTTSVVAAGLDRDSVAYEINPDYVETIIDRLEPPQKKLRDQIRVKVVREENRDDFEQRISRLPYIFRDPVKIQRKRDPRKKTFGSNITTGDRENRETFERVAEVVDPITVRLKSGRTVRLLGVVPRAGREAEAMEFIERKTSGHPIRIVTDPLCPEDNRVYFYLRNKTFINSQLIKNGLAEADKDAEYKKKNLFLKHELNQD